jgi:hypothetical protein
MKAFATAVVLCFSLMSTMHAAIFVAQPSYVDTNWSTAALWEQGDFPRALGDEAVITNVYIGNITGARTILLDIAATVTAVRFRGGTTSNCYPQVSSMDKRLYLQSASGNAQIEADSFSPQSWGSALKMPLVFLSDTDMRVTTNKIFAIAADSEFHGTGDLHLYSLLANSVVALRANASPNYTGTIYVESSIGDTGVRLEAQSYICTNARIVIRRGAILTLGSVAQCGKVISMEPGSRMDAFSSTTPSNAADVVILGGVVTNFLRKSTFMNSRGDVSGTGTLVQVILNNPGGSNIFTGSISPGLGGAGKLTINEQQGVTLLGLPGAPVTLNIEDGDQLELLNMDVPVDLNYVNVQFLTSTASGATNWFLTCTSNVVNTLNSITYAQSLGGYVVYETNRVGAVVVPEPALMLAGALALLVALCRR